MKKLLLFSIVMVILLITGCSSNSEENIIKDLEKTMENPQTYQLQGTLQTVNNEETYEYDVVASYSKGMYKVSLINKANDHEQIILKNTDGVYVLTPSLNKSFKFQSDWPNNSSQIYLLQSIIKDIKEDEERVYEETDDCYSFTVKANYPNNHKLTSQKVCFNKEKQLQSIEVYDDEENLQMQLQVTKIDENPSFSDNYFVLENTEETFNETEQTLEETIYPLYLPEGTTLDSEEKVTKTDGERIILTFTGEKPFLLVEETVSIEEELTVIPTFGEPELLIDTVAAFTENSINWTSNGIEYYIVSDVMSQEELSMIAKSLTSIAITK